MKHRPSPSRAFTTIELLVVIGIIVLLISLLVPLVGTMQQKAKGAATHAFISQLSTAMENYYQDFKAYPGPLSNDEIRRSGYGITGFAPWQGTYLREFTFDIPSSSAFADVDNDNTDGKFRITMAENLVLGLLGGLKLISVSASTFDIAYDPELVGKGPQSLNPAQPKAYSPYIEATNLSWQDFGGKRTGAFFDDASRADGTPANLGADDSIIPEFVDRYGDPMPILVARSKVGTSTTALTKRNNPVMTDDPMLTQGRQGAYDLSQIVGYTKPPAAGFPIGVSRKRPTYYEDGNVQPNPQQVHGLTDVNTARTLGPVGSGGYTYPYDAFPYFRDPALSNTTVGGSAGTGYQPPHVPRQKDKFILISAGPDRIYGTNDDITNFGLIQP